MSVEEVNDKFKQWNPMETAYKNRKFNQYVSGPGADLDAGLQPGHQAQKKDNGNNMPIPTLIFRDIPNNMTKRALNNICSKHGRVTDVRNSTKNSFYFVELATVADMEAVLRALENNTYGFKVFVDKNITKKTSNGERNKNNQNLLPVAPKSTGIDYESRSYRTSTQKHPRPYVSEEPLFNISDAAVSSKLPLELLVDDAHSLERQGLSHMPNNKKFSYRNGRSYVNMPEKTKNFIDKKHGESSGTYNHSSGKYQHIGDKKLMPNNIAKCSMCYYACDTVCSRCSQYYCGVECQLSDWPQHRYICGKPKELQKTPPATPSKEDHKVKVTKLNNIPLPTITPKKCTDPQVRPSPTSNFKSPSQLQETNQVCHKSQNEIEMYEQNMPRSGNIVTVTAIGKSNVVFIRSKTYDDNLSYFRTIDALQAIGSMLKPLKSMPTSGHMVIAKFKNQYNRALVLNAFNADKIVVNFLDYGNLDEMKLENLYEAPEEFRQKPRHAIPVILKGVPDIYITEELRKFMYIYLNNLDVQIRYKPEDFRNNRLFAVELLDENTQQNFNEMILDLSKTVEPQTFDELCNRDYLDKKLLPSGNNVEFIVMDNSLMSSGCISCTIKPYAIEIQKFQVELQSYAESVSKEAYTPTFDELCIARYSEDGKWYRGICLETVGDGHPSIHFIDYGNITTVPIEDIRRYPRRFTFPIYTADCEIKGLPEDCSDELVAKLEQLIPNGKFIKCENVEAFENENFYVISLPNVITELIECGLLKNN